MPCSRRIGHFFILAYFWRGFGGLGRKKRSTFAAKFESMKKDNLLSILLLGIVGYVYSSESKKLEDLEQKNKDLENAVKGYESEQNSGSGGKTDAENSMGYQHDSGQEGDGNSTVSDLKVSYIFRVGKIGGSKTNVSIYLVISNTSKDKSYIISDIKIAPYIHGKKLSWTAEDDGTYTINAGTSSKEFKIVGENGVNLGNGINKILQKLVADKSGKALYTSVSEKKVTLDGETEADIEFQYIGKKGAGSTVRAVYNGVSGVLRYCGGTYNAE